MLDSGKAWTHLILNARGSWLPGDPRGFHSRNHRKHSSGDYKNPPPAGEHDGLHQFVRSISRKPVQFPPSIWPIIGEALIDKAMAEQSDVLLTSVDAHHVHLLAQMPRDRAEAKLAAGRWKQAASHQVRDVLPGRIWSHSCDPIVICDRRHQVEVVRYIRDHADRGAWVWVAPRLVRG